MNICEHLTNGILDVEFRLPGSEPAWTRFDLSGMISQVTLHGKHRFCQPEQTEKHPNRVTCYGFGLSSEFCMNELPAALSAGEEFPKPGVGILTQKKGGGVYDIFHLYKVRRFPKEWHIEKDHAHFHETDTECMGIAMEIDRDVQLEQNRVVITTTVNNTGHKQIDMTEYQHNFFAIDDIPIGRGYQLRIPFDQQLADLTLQFTTLEPDQHPIQSPVRIEDGTVFWLESMENKTFHKVTGNNGIIKVDEYTWQISCEGSPASVRETCSFEPEQIVMWGIEHCICPEIHKRIVLNPGQSESFTRVWTFEDENT